MTRWSIEQRSLELVGGSPCPAALAYLRNVERAGPHVRAYVERTFRLMKLGGFDAREIRPALAWWLAVAIPRVLAGGVAPSLTVEGRHRRVDDYLAANCWRNPGPGTTMLDVGCGYPPLTAMDAARRFPDWRITGADPCFVFGVALKRYEMPNLAFVRARLQGPLPPADLVRCFNVLMYFDSEFRQQAEASVASALTPGGLFLCGVDGPRSTELRYSVYRKEKTGLAAREFAFSLDNVRPFSGVPWFCMDEGERETWLLAGLVGILRSDEDFRAAYTRRMDTLLKERGSLEALFAGAPFRAGWSVPVAQWEYMYGEVLAQLEREGYVERAVAVLSRAGCRAWRNPAGHIAVDPAIRTPAQA